MTVTSSKMDKKESLRLAKARYRACEKQRKIDLSEACEKTVAEIAALRAQNRELEDAHMALELLDSKAAKISSILASMDLGVAVTTTKLLPRPADIPA